MIALRMLIAQLLVLSLLAAYAAPVQIEYEQLYRTAERLAAEGHDEEARNRFKDLLVALHRRRAAAFRKLDQWGGARLELEAAWELNQKAPGLGNDLAYARQQAQKGRVPASSAEPGQVAAESEILGEAYNGLALIAVRRSDFTDAVRYFERLKIFCPGFPAVDLNFGLALYHAEKFREAALELEGALKRSPSDLRIKKFLGLTYAELERYQDAVPLLAEVHRSGSDDEQVLLALADCLTLSGKPDQAQQIVE